MEKISIEGLDKAEVLQALHANSRAQGMGVLQDRGNLTIEQCRAIIAYRTENGDPLLRGFIVIGQSNLYFDYLEGRVLKVDLGDTEFSPAMYDRDLGEGAAKRVIDQLREK